MTTSNDPSGLPRSAGEHTSPVDESGVVDSVVVGPATDAAEQIEADPRPRRRVLAPLALAVGLATVGTAAWLLPGSANDEAAEATSPAVGREDSAAVSRSRQRPVTTPSATPSTSASAKAIPSAKTSASAKATRTSTPKASRSAAAKSAAPTATASKSRAPKATATPVRPTPLAEVVGTRWSTTVVNVRSLPSTDARKIGHLDQDEAVKVTSLRQDGWRQVSLDGKPGWVRAAYLTDDKPKPAATSRASAASKSSAGTRISTRPTATKARSAAGGTCSSYAVERGLVSNAVGVHRAVCANFPSIKSFGGVRASADEHGSGHALDIMVSGQTGWEVARWARANASSLGITEVIYSQQIWTTQRSGEGWRPMSDRGSATANHYDHVHVTVR